MPNFFEYAAYAVMSRVTETASQIQTAAKATSNFVGDMFDSRDEEAKFRTKVQRLTPFERRGWDEELAKMEREAGGCGNIREMERIMRRRAYIRIATRNQGQHA